MESEFIRRNANTHIDLHGSIHAFAMALGRRVQEEDAIRKDRVIKRAIREQYRIYKTHTITMPYLIGLVLKSMAVTVNEYGKMEKRVRQHIRLNVGGYLKITAGKAGGVHLVRKGKQ